MFVLSLKRKAYLLKISSFYLQNFKIKKVKKILLKKTKNQDQNSLIFTILSRYIILKKQLNFKIRIVLSYKDNSLFQPLSPSPDGSGILFWRKLKPAEMFSKKDIANSRNKLLRFLNFVTDHNF